MASSSRAFRPRLLAGTALHAAVLTVLALPAAADPAPNARPLGGSVTAGSATIATTPTTTTINQATQRAAINWQSFDVGAQQTVKFVQPSSNAVALNRVVGPNPSQIAGRIDANGQVILTNQDGITFYQGAQVNTAGFVASAAGMTDKNFVAGRMVFDQAAHPGARIANAGTITVGQAGLAAFVAPEVANSGVITAKLGRVVLAGAATHTLDLYGDGLINLDVGNQVTHGPGGTTALVTNTGTIVAEGGTVQLTARAADGVVQTLIQADGSISAPTVAGRTGTVLLAGIGGNIFVGGQVSAQGTAAGTRGGAIQILPSGTATIASSARIDASGSAGGGTIALGTTLARAASGPALAAAPTSRAVKVASGAHVAANATVHGNGGRITVLSSDSTVMAGSITARGAAAGGNGGFVEVSGGSLGYSGTIDVGASQGQAGSVLFDPGTLIIQTASGDLDGSLPTILAGSGGTSDTVSVGALQAISSGTIVLQAQTLIDVQKSVTFANNVSATLLSAGNVQVDTNVVLTASGTGSLALVASGAGALTFQPGSGISAPSISLSGGSGGIALGRAAITATGGGLLVLTTTGGGGITQGAAGVLTAGGLTIAGGSVALGGAANDIGTLDGVTATALQLTNNATLAVDGPVSANTVALTAAAGDLLLAGNVTGTTSVSLAATVGNIVQSAGSLTAGTLTASAFGSLDLGLANAVGTLGAASATSSFVLADGNALTVTGPVRAETITLSTATNDLALAGNLTGTTDVALTATAGNITQASGGIATARLSANASGAITLGSVLNTVTLVTGAVAGGGNLTLTDGGSLTLAGTARGQNVAITAASNGAVLTLGSGAVPATVTATAAGGSVALTADLLAELPTSTIATDAAGSVAFAPFSSSPVSLLSGAGLLLDATLFGEVSTGTLIVGSVAKATNIALGTSLNLGATTLDLLTGGSITQAGGLIVGTFAATATNGVTLDSTLNAIGTLGAISAGPSLAVTNDLALTVSGPLSATGISLTTLLGNLTLAGNVNGTASVGLAANLGSIVQSGSAVTAGTLTASAPFGSIGLGETVNAIGTVGAASALTSLTIANGAALTIAGPVSAPAVVLSTQTGDLTLAGSVTGTTSLALTAAGGNVTQPAGGTVTTAALTGSASGAFGLGSTLNAITAVDSVSAGSSLTIVNAATLAVSGTVSGDSVTLRTLTGNLTLTGTITGTTDLALRADAGSVFQSLGTVTAGSLSGNAGTTFFVASAADSITALGSISAGTGLEVVGGSPMTVNGPITAPTAILATVAGDLTLAGSIGGTTQIQLVALAGNITQTGGTITTPSLTAEASGSLSLGATVNAIGTVTGATAGTGDLLLANGGNLTLTGTLSGQDVAVQVAGGGTLALGSGAIATTITATAAGGSISLVADRISDIAGNTVTAGTVTIAPFSATQVSLFGTPGAQLLIDAALLSEINTTTLVIGSTTAATGIAIDGAADLIGHVATLDLLASGSITEPGGPLSVSTLAATANGIALGSALNAIGTLDGVSAGTGDLVLVNAGNLVLAGTVGGRSATLEVALAGGTLALGSGVVAASVTAATDITLLADRITEIAGSSIADAGTLTLAPVSAEAVSLAGTAGAHLLIDTTLLGEISTGTLAVGNVATTGISVDGATDLTGHASALALLTSGSISQPGGPVTVTTLTASAGTGIALGSALNAIGTVDGAAAGSGDLVLADGGNLTLAGTLSGQNATVEVALAGGTLALGQGGVTAALTATAAGGNISLLADRITDVAGSSIADAGTLAIAPVSANAISLAGTPGAALLLDGRLLGEISTGTLVIGNVSTATAISVDGAANLTGRAGALDLLTTGSIGEAGGQLTVPVLRATAGTGIGLGSTANAIGTVAGATAGSGDLLLANGTDLTLTGTESGQNVAITVASGTLALGSGVVAATVTATAAAGNVSLVANRISEIAGSAITDAGTLTIAPFSASAVSLAGTPGAHLLLDTTLLGEIGTATLVVGSTATATGISVDGAVDLTGHASTLDLRTSGSITEPAGALTVPVLTATANGIALGAALNAIGTVDGAAAGSGGLVLTDGSNLVLAGTLSGQSATIEVAAPGDTLAIGSGVVAATVTATGNISLVADRITDIAGSSVATAGTLAIAPVSANPISLAGSAGAHLLLDSTLLADISTGTLVVGSLATATAISVDGAANLTGRAGVLDLLTSGTIAEPGGPITVGVLTATAGTGIALGSTLNAIGTVDTATAGSGDFLLTNGSDLTLAGILSGRDVAVDVAVAGGTLALGGRIATTLTATGAGGSVTLVADRITDIAGDSVAAGTVAIAPFSANAVSLAGTAGAHLLVDTRLLGEISTGTLIVGSTTTATAIAIDGATDLTGHATVLDLLARGSIAEPGGPVTVGTLSATAGSGIALASTANAIGTVAGATAGSGNLLLANGTDLTLAGALRGQNVTLDVARTGGTLALGSGIVAASVSATAAGGSVTVRADRITDIPGSSIGDAGTLTITPFSANAVSLAGTPGAHLLLDTTLLAEITTGTLVVGSLATTTGIAVDGAASLTGHATTLDLRTSGAITEPGGALAVPVLTATAADGIVLGSVLNAIGAVHGAAAGSGDLVLTDASNLTLTGTLSGRTATIAIVAVGDTLAFGSGAVTAALTATGGSISLTADRITDIAGSSIADAGTLTIAPFSATPISLAGTPGAQLLLDATLLGDITTGTLIIGSLATATAISVDGATDLTGHAATLDLLTSGNIAEPGGPLTVATLIATAGTGIGLGSTANAIGTLDGIASAGGGIVIGDASALVVAGPVGADSVALTSLGALDVLAGIAATGQLALTSGADMTLAASASLDAGSMALAAGGALDDFANLTAAGPMVLAAGGTMTLAAGASLAADTVTLASTGVLDVLAGVSAAGQLALSGGAGIVLAGSAPVFGAAIQLNGGSGGTTLSGTGLLGSADSSLDLVGSGGVSQATTSTIAARVLTSSVGITGTVALAGTANAIAGIGGIAVSAGDLALADGGAGTLTVTGPVTATNIALGTAGGLPATIAVAGSIAATTSLSLAGTSGIALGTAASLDGASIALASGGPITLAAGASVGDPATTVSFSSTGGSVIEDAGARITAATLDSLGGIAGAATFAGTANAVATLQNLAAASLLLADGNAFGLTIAGHVTASGGVAIGSTAQPTAIGVTGTLTGQSVTLAAGAAGIRLSGSVVATTVAELDAAGGGVLQTGRLAAATLRSAGVTGPVDLANASLGTLDAFPVTRGGFTLSNSTGLVVDGPVSADAIAIAGAGGLDILGTLTAAGSLALTATSGGIALGGGGTAALLSAGSVGLTATGPISEPDGIIEADALAVTGAASVNLGSTANRIATLGTVDVVGGSFLLADDAAPLLTVVGPVTAASVSLGTPAALTVAGSIAASGRVALAAGAGGISFGTTASPGFVTAGTLALSSGGTIGEPNGLITATQLQAASAGTISLTNAANAIATLGAVSVGGGDFVLADGAPLLTVFGPVSAGNVTIDPPTALTVTGTITAPGQLSLTAGSGGMALAGVLNAGTLTLTSSGGISEPGGTIVASTLTGSSAGATTLGSTANAIGQITSFTAGTEFALADATALTLSGTLAAPLIDVTMPASTFTLGNGAAITTGGIAEPANFVLLDASAGGAIALAAQIPTPDKPALSGGRAAGAYLTVGAFTQLGTSRINSITVGGNSLLRIDTGGAGNVNFANLQGLGTWLLIDINAGTVTGNIVVQGLTLQYPAISGGARLTGSINNISGQAAAGAATILPLPNSKFQLNNCPIHSVNCVLLPLETIPAASPLEYFTIGALLDSNDDDTLLLPIVSNQDY